MHARALACPLCASRNLTTEQAGQLEEHFNAIPAIERNAAAAGAGAGAGEGGGDEGGVGGDEAGGGAAGEADAPAGGAEAGAEPAEPKASAESDEAVRGFLSFTGFGGAPRACALTAACGWLLR